MQQICKELLPDTRRNVPDLINKLNELLGIVQRDERNIKNFCFSGGLWEIFSLILSHPDRGVKKLACQVLTEATANKKEVQEFALKIGALNLTQQI